MELPRQVLAVLTRQARQIALPAKAAPVAERTRELVGLPLPRVDLRRELSLFSGRGLEASWPLVGGGVAFATSGSTRRLVTVRLS